MNNYTITIESRIGNNPRGDGDYHVRTVIDRDGKKPKPITRVTQERPYGTGDYTTEFSVFEKEHERCRTIDEVMFTHAKIHDEWEEFAKKERMKNGH